LVLLLPHGLCSQQRRLWGTPQRVALPSELLGNLTQNPDYKEHLRGILSYHVVWGRETAMDIKDGGSLRTLLHEDVSTSVMDGKIFINDAQVVAGDLTAYNGVLHKLDKVLIPEFMTKNIIQVIYDLGHFNTLRTALDTAGLTSALEVRIQFDSSDLIRK